MDHETSAESELGWQSEASESSEAMESSEASEPSEASNDDLGADSSLMSDSFDTQPAPEWPAVDLAIGAAARDNVAVATDDAEIDSADPVDDSDAPVVLDGSQTIQAENVNLSQGGVNSIEASNVTLSQGGAGQVRAEHMSVEMGGVGLARVDNLTMGNGASAFAVLADRATVQEGSNTFLVVTRTLSGDVRPTIDWRGAMAFGAGLGLVVSILRRLR